MHILSLPIGWIAACCLIDMKYRGGDLPLFLFANINGLPRILMTEWLTQAEISTLLPLSRVERSCLSSQLRSSIIHVDA